MLKSVRNASSSTNNNPAAMRRCAATVSRVTGAVTLGFPSRSPPIHEASRTGADVRGRRPPRALSVASRRRRKSGTASQSDVSTTAKPPRASCWGDGFARRSSSEPHKALTTPASSLSTSFLS